MAGISLGANLSAIAAQRELDKATSAIGKTYQRLSSGLRINDASDDAAGIAVASTLNVAAVIAARGVQNVNDGISATNVAEGALNSLRDITMRQQELAEQAANGSYGLAQRQALNNEANALVNEFNRIVGSTTFNGLTVLDPALGSVILQAGTGTSNSIGVSFAGSLAHNVGSGSFNLSTVSVGAGSLIATEATAIADVNNDGKMDVLAANSNGSVYTLLGNGDGSFLAPTSFTVAGGTQWSIVTSDVNGDGRIDVVAADATANQFTIFLGNGNGSFSTGQNLTATAGGHTWVQVGDANGDGITDVFTTNSSRTEVFLGNGNGSFKASRSSAGMSDREIQVGDLNGDGMQDMVTFDYGADKVFVLIGRGDGTFNNPSTISLTGGSGPCQIMLGDFNRDGVLDLVTAEHNSGVSNVFLGNEDGSFRASRSFAQSSISQGVTVADLNGDGNLDFYTVHFSEELDINYGNGDGTFRAYVSIAVTGGGAGSSAGSADFNGDGALDIAYGGFSPSAVTFLTANPTATSSTPYLNIATAAGARGAITSLAANLQRVETQLGIIGASQGRFGVIVQTLQAQRDNMLQAAGRITDADIAGSASDLARQQILQQSAAAVLAQANTRPQLALKLLGAG